MQFPWVTIAYKSFDLLFSIVGSYESTNCPSTNCIVRDDLPMQGENAHLQYYLMMMMISESFTNTTINRDYKMQCIVSRTNI